MKSIFLSVICQINYTFSNQSHNQSKQVLKIIDRIYENVASMCAYALSKSIKYVGSMCKSVQCIQWLV